MNTHAFFTKALSSWNVKLFRLLFALIFALSLMGLQPAHPVAADSLASCTGCTTSTADGNVIYTFTGSGTATNGAPAVSLVQPADGASGVSTTPNLQVTVTDPDADTSDVSFYGRAAGAGTAADFMLALIPDPQNESQYNVDLFKAQTNWIVNNKTANNIVYVTATGDMVNTSSDAAQYANADSAVDILDTGGVPYTMATGNHDIAMGTTLYANYFGASRYASHLYSDGYWFGGSYDNYNTYSLFSAAGMDFILINLQYSPTTADINWADTLLTTYTSRRAIVEQHDILNTDNSWNNQTSYNALRRPRQPVPDAVRAHARRF